MLLEVVLGHRPVAHDDERPQPLPVVVVVDADGGGLDDAVVAGQAVLDLLGKTFSPPETIISSSRPSTKSRPSSSKRPTSPVAIRPSTTSLLPPPV